MENNQSWDCALKISLNDMGLVQALRGFELDMLVLNPGWERETVPSALERLLRISRYASLPSLLVVLMYTQHLPDPVPDTLDDRKAALYTDPTTPNHPHQIHLAVP